jgi:heme/copper-type cytochrome/quinol oxidase subunit 3
MSIQTHSHNAHHEDPDVVGSRNRLGVILILVADIAFALSMVFVYFYLRAQNVNDMWLPKATEEHAAVVAQSSNKAWTITAIAALGLSTHFYALKGARAHNDIKLKLGSLVSLVTSIVAIYFQVNTFTTAPFTFSDGAYVSCFYLFAVMNFVHLSLTVFIAFGNWNRARLGLYETDVWHVEIVNVWWVWMVVSSLLGAFCLSFP